MGWRTLIAQDVDGLHQDKGGAEEPWMFMRSICGASAPPSLWTEAPADQELQDGTSSALSMSWLSSLALDGLPWATAIELGAPINTMDEQTQGGSAPSGRNLFVHVNTHHPQSSSGVPAELRGGPTISGTPSGSPLGRTRNTSVRRLR